MQLYYNGFIPFCVYTTYFTLPTIAYPSGRYNQTTLGLAKKTYKLGLTTNEGLASANDGLISLNRVRILPTTTAKGLLSEIDTDNE